MGKMAFTAQRASGMLARLLNGGSARPRPARVRPTERMEKGRRMTVDVGADTIAVLVGLLTLAIALWAQIWRTGRGIRSDLNERMDGLESKVDDSTKLL